MIIKWLLLVLILASTKLLADDFTSFMDSFASLKIDIKQIINDDVSNGVLIIDKKNRNIKLHISEPYEEIIMLTNNKITHLDSWLKVAHIKHYETNDLVELLLGNKTDLTATRINNNSYYKYNNILFEFVNGELIKIVNIEEGFTKVVMLVTNIVINPILNNEFILELNEDIDIIDET